MDIMVLEDHLNPLIMNQCWMKSKLSLILHIPMQGPLPITVPGALQDGMNISFPTKPNQTVFFLISFQLNYSETNENN